MQPTVELYLFKGDTNDLQDMVVAAALKVGQEVSYAQQRVCTITVQEDGKPDKLLTVTMHAVVVGDRPRTARRSIAKISTKYQQNVNKLSPKHHQINTT